jgi:pimeloyl-[acyl-carrier protein] methyl ester esterase
MSYRVEILAQHGWAFESSVWDCWLEFLPDGWQFSAFERGYFFSQEEKNAGKFLHPALPSWNGTGISNRSLPARNRSQALKILMAHSFGLHCLPLELIEAADLLVVIGGFEEFHASENAVSRRSVRRMLVRLASDYRVVLNDFYSASFGDAVPAFVSTGYDRNCDLERLTSDLRQLDAGRVCMDGLRHAKSILILHGELDSIVPVERARSLQERLPGSQLLLHRGAGHALPFTHPEWCLKQIVAALPQLCPSSVEVPVT